MSVPRICAAKNISKSVPQDPNQSIKLILRYSSIVLQRASVANHFERYNTSSMFLYILLSFFVLRALLIVGDSYLSLQLRKTVI